MFRMQDLSPPMLDDKRMDMRKHCLQMISLTCLILSATGCTSLDLFGPHSLGKVSPEAWSKLKVGMTKKRVTALLGESGSRSGPTEMEETDVMWTPEHWEYGWTNGLSLFGPSSKAHVVYFGEDGRVASFRGPRENSSAHNYEDIGTLRIGSDSLESIADRKEGSRSQTLKPPIPLQPANRSVFNHYPREIVFHWKSAPGTLSGVQYYTQTDFTTWGDDETFGEWKNRDPILTHRTGKTSMNYRHVGAQPGRWRVKVFNKSGESEWCAWQYFRFTR
jgi:hypothetical protein